VASEQAEPPATRSLRGSFLRTRNSEAEQNAWWDRTADVPMRAYGHRMRLLRTSICCAIGEVHAPAWCFTSPNDWVVPAPAGRLLAKRLPRAKLLHPIPAGHAAMIDPRVDVAAWLKDERLWEDHAPGPAPPGGF